MLVSPTLSVHSFCCAGSGVRRLTFRFFSSRSPATYHRPSFAGGTSDLRFWRSDWACWSHSNVLWALLDKAAACKDLPPPTSQSCLDTSGTPFPYSDCTQYVLTSPRSRRLQVTSPPRSAPRCHMLIRALLPASLHGTLRWWERCHSTSRNCRPALPTAAPTSVCDCCKQISLTGLYREPLQLQICRVAWCLGPPCKWWS
jgi:hypothetical protein